MARCGCLVSLYPSSLYPSRAHVFSSFSPLEHNINTNHTPSSSALVSRQFVEMTRVRIEGLLAAFPKLVAGVASTGGGRQHTYVETDTVRYLYQPLEVRKRARA